MIGEDFENQSDQQNVENISKSLQRFGVLDYVVFIIMLLFCSIIGIYFGYEDHKAHKRNRLKERRGSEAINYLMGGRKLHVFPVSMSLVSSFISGITLLGTSTEVYLYGTQYAFILISVLLTYFFMYFVIIPVFHNLSITSTYEVIF
jgi:sodium-coupled monocarboxylate transporter 8/12